MLQLATTSWKFPPEGGNYPVCSRIFSRWSQDYKIMQARSLPPPCPSFVCLSISHSSIGHHCLFVSHFSVSHSSISRSFHRQKPLSHELSSGASERPNEWANKRRGAREQSKQCGAHKWVSGANERTNEPTLTLTLDGREGGDVWILVLDAVRVFRLADVARFRDEGLQRKKSNHYAVVTIHNIKYAIDTRGHKSM